MSDADAESDAESDGALPDPPAPPYQLVTGTAIIDDLDAFLSALDEIAAETGAVVQAFDADFVVSAAHPRSEAPRLAARSPATTPPPPAIRASRFCCTRPGDARSTARSRSVSGGGGARSRPRHGISVGSRVRTGPTRTSTRPPRR